MSSHRRLSVCVGQDAVDLDLAGVQGAQIHPQLVSPSVCRTKTLPSVVSLGVLLRGRGQVYTEHYICVLYQALSQVLVVISCVNVN